MSCARKWIQLEVIIVKKWNQPQSVSNIPYIFSFVIPRFLNRLNQANGTVKSVNSSHGLQSRRVRSSNSREGRGRRERWAMWRERASKYMHTCMRHVLIQPFSCTINTDELQLKLKKKKNSVQKTCSRKPICEALYFKEIFSIVFCVLVSASAEDEM